MDDDKKKTYEDIKDRPVGDLSFTEEEEAIIAEKARAELASPSKK